MSSYDVFLSFIGDDPRRSSFAQKHYDAFERSSETHNLFCDHDDHEQSKNVIAEGYLPSSRTQLLMKAIEELKSCLLVLPRDYAPSRLCFEEHVKINNLRKEYRWCRTSASNKEFSLTCTELGFAYNKYGFVQAVRDQTTVVPHSLSSCYMDYFQSNVQKQKASSWKHAAPVDESIVTLEILNLLNNEGTRFPCTYSCSQFQICNDTSLQASEVLPTRNPRVGESINMKLYCLDTNYKLSDGSVYKKIGLKTKVIGEAPSDPFRDSSPITARKSSTSALLMTIFVLSTFLAAVSFSSSTFKEDYLNSKDTMITSRSIVAINSLVFIMSLVTDMFLLHEFKYEWELQIVLFALFGAYICLTKATIPQAALPLFMISFPFLLIAAVWCHLNEKFPPSMIYHEGDQLTRDE